MSLRAAFAGQAKACGTMGSPFMERLMGLAGTNLTDETAVGARLFAWEGDVSSRSDSLPLRLAGALHRLVLTGQCPALAAVYPPHNTTDAALWEAVEHALIAHQPALLDWLDSPPQTNEVRRSAALIPAFHMIADRTGLPLHLTELGASAGLNLLADHFALDAAGQHFGPPDAPVTLSPKWAGPVPRPAPTVRITARHGNDLRPVDLADPAQVTRLLGYLWPDQPDRLDRTRAAIAIARDTPLRMAAGNAADFLEAALLHPRPGAAHVVFHTVAWQYFPQTTATRARAALERAGADATVDAPLFHLALEADDLDTPGATLALTEWPGGRTYVLARVDFHGRWVDWTGPISLE